MSIPESQLDTWAKQGSVIGSSTTYNAVKDALNDSSSPYYPKEFDVFLQGSYGNDTNIYAESDVDVVIQLKSTFQQDLSGLAEGQRLLFNQAFSAATYGLVEFKRDVLAHLRGKFGSGVNPGNKAIAVPATSYRRKADVIVALEYRKYASFFGTYTQDYVEGIKFHTTTGLEIINYPKPHARNLTRKHQETGGWLKPVIRVFKNLRTGLKRMATVAWGRPVILPGGAVVQRSGRQVLDELRRLLLQRHQLATAHGQDQAGLRQQAVLPAAVGARDLLGPRQV